MENATPESETVFVREVLDYHGKYLIDRMQRHISKHKIYFDGHLYKSLSYSIASDSHKPTLNIHFLSYGRALEIRFFQRSRNTKNWVTDTNLAVWGISRKPRKFKNVLFYSRTVYGSQSQLIYLLSSKYSEHQLDRIKSVLDNAKVTASI